MKIGPGKCSFEKQHLNPKMPKCHFDVHFRKKDIYDLFYTMYVGKAGYNFSYKIQLFGHCTCAPEKHPFLLRTFP